MVVVMEPEAGRIEALTEVRVVELEGEREIDESVVVLSDEMVEVTLRKGVVIPVRTMLVVVAVVRGFSRVRVLILEVAVADRRTIFSLDTDLTAGEVV
jgi:hypothetical protein